MSIHQQAQLQRVQGKALVLLSQLRCVLGPPCYGTCGVLHHCAEKVYSRQSRPVVQGSAKKKAFLVLSGLLVLVAVICGIGYLVFIRDSGDPTSSTSSQDGTLLLFATQLAFVS